MGLIYADFTFLAPPDDVQTRLQSTLAEHGFQVSWNGKTGRVQQSAGAGWRRNGNGVCFEVAFHTSPGNYTVVRFAPVGNGRLRRDHPLSRALIERMTATLQMQGILRGVSVWD